MKTDPRDSCCLVEVCPQPTPAPSQTKPVPTIQPIPFTGKVNLPTPSSVPGQPAPSPKPVGTLSTFGLLVCWEFVWPCLGNDIDIKDNSTTVLTLDITLVRQIFMCTFTEIWSDFIFIFFKWISISYWFFFLPILIGFCVYKSVTYMQGQKWDDGCDYACTCYDAEHGRYKCDPK